MGQDHWTDRLSEYLDGELDERTRSALEAHLVGCGDCAEVLGDLRAITANAAGLEDVAPARDLWPEIRAGMIARAGAGRASWRRRSVRMSVPQLIAAGITMLVLPAAAAWMALDGPWAAPAAPRATTPPGVVRAASTGSVPASAGEPATYLAPYENALGELETQFEARRPALDPGMILVLERNLAIIDAAIGDARRALEADPTSEYLNAYVVTAMDRKIDLLREATRLQRAES